jgi:hypothetical protein
VRWVRALDGLALFALVGLGLAWALLSGQDPFLYRGGFWLTELAVAILITAAAHPAQSLLARGLAWRPLVAFGRISYGVYLWHWPIFVVLNPDRLGVDGASLTALRLAATFAFAIASYRWVERPIRHGGLRFGRPWLVVPGIVAALVAGLVFAAPSTSAFEVPDDEGGRVRVLIVGDSLSGSLAECAREVEPRTPITLVGGQGGCNILSDEFPLDPKQGGGDCDTTWASVSAALRPHVTAVVLGGGFFAAAEIDGRWQRPCDDGWHWEYLRELIEQLQQLQRSSTHVVLALVPYYEGTNLAHLTNKTRMACFNDTLREAASAVPGVTLLDLFAEVCPGGVCIQTHQGAPLRADGLHFSRPACHEVAAWALDQLLDTVGIARPP